MTTKVQAAASAVSWWACTSAVLKFEQPISRFIGQNSCTQKQREEHSVPHHRRTSGDVQQRNCHYTGHLALLPSDCVTNCTSSSQKLFTVTATRHGMTTSCLCMIQWHIIRTTLPTNQPQQFQNCSRRRQICLLQTLASLLYFLLTHSSSFSLRETALEQKPCNNVRVHICCRPSVLKVTLASN